MVSIDWLRVVCAEPDDDLRFAADFAAEETARICGVRPPVISRNELTEDQFGIVLQRMPPSSAEYGESFSLKASDRSLVISASHRRGFLYGIGRLLRTCSFRAGKLEVPGGLDKEFRPASRIRGHQIGYGHMSNSMDSWTVAQFERYLRDLILFGCNAIEIEYKPDDSQYHTLPFDEMAAELSKLAARYGLDCTLWVPNWGDEPHYLDPVKSDRALRDLGRFLSLLPHLSALTVPGGDPGSLRPRVLFPWVERLTGLMESSGHPPRAWISAQWMKADHAWYDEFFEHANRRPSWLIGVVQGPWTQLSVSEVRRRLRTDIPVRRYTDLTHGIYCQYPVKDWDLAHAMTSGREPVNPRPLAYKHIHNLYCADAVGSTPHTTGVNADANVFVWLDQEWDPQTDVRDTLEQYARVFLDSSVESEFVEAVLALERNWEGPLSANHGVRDTLERWRMMETTVSDKVRRNWRFESMLLRAHFDAHIQNRLIRQSESEVRACRALAGDLSTEGIRKAIALLSDTDSDAAESGLRNRCETLAESLNRSIGLKSSVPRHGAAQKGRGAFMDAIDEPLNDSRWMVSRLSEALEAPTDIQRQTLLDSVMTRTDAGPDGIYDNLGNPNQIGRFVNPVDFENDPGGLAGSRWGFGIDLHGMPRSQTVEVKSHDGEPIPLAWLTCAEAIYATPLTIAYAGLDDVATYRLRVVYPSRIGRKARLVANDSYVVHECIETGDAPYKDYVVPAGVVENGRLKFQWTGEGERGIQVAELWLVKERGKSERKEGRRKLPVISEP